MSGEQQDPPDLRAAPPHLARAVESDSALGRSLALVRFLRDRCAWDAKQTPATLQPYLLEEAHEVADAIRDGDDPELARELGDLLLNVAFQIVLAEERGSFGTADVVRELEAKMRERHPHLYGAAAEAPDWEELKARARSERAEAGGASDPFEGIPSGLEPLSRALRLQDRAAALNFDWPDVSGALEKLREETGELEGAVADAKVDPGVPAGPDARIEDEMGDLLFAAVNVARLAGLHPSTALDRASAKFAARFRALLELARERGIDPTGTSLEALDALWEEVKANGG
jgi:nucleoside triphosphate diphosphatase